MHFYSDAEYNFSDQVFLLPIENKTELHFLTFIRRIMGDDILEFILDIL